MASVGERAEGSLRKMDEQRCSSVQPLGSGRVNCPLGSRFSLRRATSSRSAATCETSAVILEEDAEGTGRASRIRLRLIDWGGGGAISGGKGSTVNVPRLLRAGLTLWRKTSVPRLLPTDGDAAQVKLERREFRIRASVKGSGCEEAVLSKDTKS